MRLALLGKSACRRSASAPRGPGSSLRRRCHRSGMLLLCYLAKWRSASSGVGMASSPACKSHSNTRFRHSFRFASQRKSHAPLRRPVFLPPPLLLAPPEIPSRAITPPPALCSSPKGSLQAHAPRKKAAKIEEHIYNPQDQTDIVLSMHSVFCALMHLRRRPTEARRKLHFHLHTSRGTTQTPIPIIKASNAILETTYKRERERLAASYERSESGFICFHRCINGRPHRTPSRAYR